MQELAEKYNLSKEFIAILQSQKDGGEKMNFSKAKEIIKKIKQKRTVSNDKKIGENDEDIILGFEELKELYGEEFDLTFFRKGINMLRLGMMTITQVEQKALKKRGEKKGEKISFNLSDEELDKKERLLRDKIGIDELKREIEYAKISGNNKRIVECEYKATNKILEALYEYPYQDTENDYGYQPNKIAEFKEIYCVGFSLLGHTFLKELGINHHGLNIPLHSAIEVVIGNTLCYFDPTASKIAIPYKYGKSKGIYNKVEFLIGKVNEKIFAHSYSGDIEKVLLSKLCNNKGAMLENNNEAKKMYDKALKYNPKLSSSYHGKWLSLLIDGKYKISLLYKYTANLMKGKKGFIDILYRKEKTQIKQFIDSQNFDGLREYLLELEKQNN